MMLQFTRPTKLSSPQSSIRVEQVHTHSQCVKSVPQYEFLSFSSVCSGVTDVTNIPLARVAAVKTAINRYSSTGSKRYMFALVTVAAQKHLDWI